VTDAVLEALARHSARATFNVLGERVEGREELLRRTVAEGHEIGNHAFHHDRLAGRPREALRQLRRTNAAIREAIGVAPRIFRAPYGAVSRSVVLAARASRLVTVRWDVDPHDYETPGAETIHCRVVRRARPGSIVLLHDDRKALQQTAIAVDWILRDLGERGFEFVTVPELLGLARPASR
jgi:peptidoglycan/xylan/chitin deacetylase (PgdA/CDA1 family)